ncbi:hypothetical protein [Lacrimispora xylanisolvens]|uniref:hypothetical protein n=1 Tax=Lacrimispora xylanisolvens TaxID=384636 RepID=UPI002402D3E4
MQQSNGETIELFEDENIIRLDIMRSINAIKENDECNQQVELNFLLILDARDIPKPIEDSILNYCPPGMEKYRERVNVIDNYKLTNIIS